MHQLEDDWEFNVLGVYNYRRHGQFAGYYRFLRECHEHVEGDVAEVGVYRGSSLLATAMLLRELGSSKKVWGFDSFSGFPGYAEQDQLSCFDQLRATGTIAEEHYARVQRNISLRQMSMADGVDVKNISSSGDFANTSLTTLEKKIAFLGLDNVCLVKGSFAETMTGECSQRPASLCAAMIDCDLYEGYRVSLPYVWERLSKGGYIHLDEYYSLKFPGARLASDEFFSDKADKPQKHDTPAGEFERWFVRRIFG